MKESSARRIAASRANGAKSQGPKTPEGKAISSQNARKHSLTAARIVLTDEDWEDFVRSRDGYLCRFQPIDQVELDCVEDMVVCRWMQKRFWTLHSASIDDEVEEQKPEIERIYTECSADIRIARAFGALADRSKSLALMNRYESRYIRQFERAAKALKEFQANRPPHLQGQQNKPPEPAPQPETEKLPNEPNEPKTEIEHPVRIAARRRFQTFQPLQLVIAGPETEKIGSNYPKTFASGTTQCP